MAALSDLQNDAAIAEIQQSISRFINFLTDTNRATRKKGLEGIQKELFRNDASRSCYVLTHVYKEFQVNLVRLFSDPVEKCRELAIAIATEYLRATKNAESMLSYVVPVIVQRLGQQEIVESSEELRLQLVLLMTQLVQMAGKLNQLYLDDFVKVLQRTIVDPFPEVKKESCACASILAKSIPEHFHMQSETLIKPLLLSISHQHSKVRVAVVYAIGDVLLYGNNKNVDDVVSHLAQRLFDQIPAVREAVTRVAGCWLLDLPDRYSFWHKLLPLLLTGVTDELPCIRDEASSLWHDVGIRYLRENETDLKEKEDFAAPPPQHYPLGVERPNLGCRELMYRNQSKILPGLSRDILDWVIDTRKKSAALLTTIVINSENNITQHIQLLCETIYKAAVDDESDVVSYVERSAELLGYFVRPDAWIPIVLPAIQKHQSYGSILALANLVKGSDPRLLRPHLLSICQIMSQPDVCTVKMCNVQRKTLDFVSAVLSLHDCKDISSRDIEFSLFRTVLSVMSVAADEQVKHKANACLWELARQHPSDAKDENLLEGLFREHAVPLLDSFGDSYLHWKTHSVERLIFDTLLVYSGVVVGEILGRVIPILVTNLSPDNDPEVRLQLFTLIAKLVQQAPEALNSANSFKDYAMPLVKEMILPNCVWKAGRTASAIRATALSCLWSLLKNGVLTKDILQLVVEDTLTQLLSLMEDDLLDTRLIACRVLMHILNITGASIDQHRLYNLYPHLLKRLDDGNDAVRIAVAKTFESYMGCFAGSFDARSYRAHLEDIIRGLLIHMDDPNPEIQDAVLEVLKNIAGIECTILVKEVEIVREKHRTAKYCNALIRHCHSLVQGVAQ